MRNENIAQKILDVCANWLESITIDTQKNVRPTRKNGVRTIRMPQSFRGLLVELVLKTYPVTENISVQSRLQKCAPYSTPRYLLFMAQGNAPISTLHLLIKLFPGAATYQATYKS